MPPGLPPSSFFPGRFREVRGTNLRFLWFLALGWKPTSPRPETYVKSCPPSTAFERFKVVENGARFVDPFRAYLKLGLKELGVGVANLPRHAGKRTGMGGRRAGGKKNHMGGSLWGSEKELEWVIAPVITRQADVPPPLPKGNAAGRPARPDP